MADQNETGGRKALDFGKDVGRVKLAWNCSMQIGAMVQAIVDAARSQNDDLDLLVMAIGRRLEEVNDIANRALQDDGESLRDLCHELYGLRMPANAKELANG